MEGRLDKEAEQHVERHLEKCDSCKDYYQTMSAILEDAEPDKLPKLQADPYLPFRVKNKVTHRREPFPRPLMGLSKSLALSLVILALFLGFMSGQFLVYIEQQNQEPMQEASITELYYEGIAQPNIGSQYQKMLTQLEGDQP